MMRTVMEPFVLSRQKTEMEPDMSLIPPHSPSQDTTTDFTVPQTSTSSSVLQGSPILLNDEEDRDIPRPISRRRSPLAAQGTKKFRSPRSSKS